MFFVLIRVLARLSVLMGLTHVKLASEVLTKTNGFPSRLVCFRSIQL